VKVDLGGGRGGRRRRIFRGRRRGRFEDLWCWKIGMGEFVRD
jgi:hypothetical protein